MTGSEGKEMQKLKLKFGRESDYASVQSEG